MTTSATPSSPKIPLTDWFDGRRSPAHEGVYQRRPADRDGIVYACWNGRLWNTGTPDAASAAASRTADSDQRAAWRGLARSSGLPCATCKGHTIVDRGHDEETGTDLLEECVDC